MSVPATNVSVWVGDHLVCAKIAGRANFTCSVDFRTFVHALWEKGHRRFVLDLTDCLLMDSTFLGVLAGFALRANSEGARNGDQGSVELVNANSRVADLLENLGVSHLFKAVKGTAALTDRMQTMEKMEKPALNPDRKEISRLCLEAHETLMAINPANVPKFKDVAKFLAEDLQRMDGSKS
jgi:anti-anti-sigma factor